MFLSRAALVILLLRVTTAMCGLGVIGVTHAWAQDGVIGFLDICNSMAPRAYVMRGAAESASNPRVPLPALQSLGPPLDISTTGPVTVLRHGLVAIQVNDVGGSLVPEAPVSIQLPDDPDDPDDLPPNTNSSSFVRFSPLGDRVAIVTSFGVLVIADIVRDVNDKIIGLTNPTVAVNLLTLGSPSDSSVSSGPPASYPDFSPGGSQIVVTIYGDLWLLDLASDGHTFVSAEPLTRTVRDTEWQAVFSPDGSRIAYVGATNKGGAGPDSRSPRLYTLDLGTREITQVMPSGAVVGLRDPAWSPDGQGLAFVAVGPRARGRADNCGVGNYDVFLVGADGTGTPALLTTSVGTGVEMRTQWGW